MDTRTIKPLHVFQKGKSDHVTDAKYSEIGRKLAVPENVVRFDI